MPTLLFISAVKKREGIQGSFSVPAESGYAHSKTQAYPGDPVFEFHQAGRVIEVLNVSEGLFSYSLLAWLIGNWWVYQSVVIPCTFGMSSLEDPSVAG